MTNELTDLDAYRARAREWIEAHLEPKPLHEEVLSDAFGAYKSEETIAEERSLQRTLYDGGWAGISWPSEYGGQGLSPAHERAFAEEARDYRLPDLGVAGGVTFGVCVPTMLIHASPSFLAHHVPRVLAGDELWAQFFSEPGAGSDLAGVTTRADRSGDGWVLNGSKVWSSGAYYSDYGMCLARTNWDVPKHRGLTWFAVPTDATGVTVQPIRMINGDAEFCQEFFDNVELSDDDVIGDVDTGWKIAQTMLVFERGANRPDRLPSGAGMPAFAPDLVSLIRRVGREKDSAARQLLARAHIHDLAERHLVRRIVGMMQASKGTDTGVAAYAKLAAGTFAAERARIGMEIGRGGALVWEKGDLAAETTSADYLIGRIKAIAGGTNETQRNGIGERVLGLPREPAFDLDKPFQEVVHNAANWSGKVS
jgi:alkylation response protein AidB-like acyl-CoA dehydrogenase